MTGARVTEDEVGRYRTNEAPVILVHVHEQINGILPYLQGRRMREKIVANKEAHENKVVDEGLFILRNDTVINLKVQLQILAQFGNRHKLEGFHRDGHLSLGLLSLTRLIQQALHFLLLRLLFRLGLLNLLSQDGTLSFVRSQTQHDQISIKAVNNVAHIRIITLKPSLQADELHNLMLPLPRAIRVTQYDLYIPPGGIVIQAQVDVVLQRDGQPPHEGRSRRNDIAVKGFRLLLRRDLNAFFLKPFPQVLLLCLPLFRLLSSPKAPASLLVHLRTRCNAVNGEEEELPRPNHREQPVNVLEYVAEHLVLRRWIRLHCIQ